jgi:hypothetical protein
LNRKPRMKPKPNPALPDTYVAPQPKMAPFAFAKLPMQVTLALEA